MKDQPAQTNFKTTLWNALILNADFYENARNTPRNHRIARTIVLLSAVSHLLGSAIILLINLAQPLILFVALILDGLSVIGGYYFWSFTINIIGEKFKPNHVSYQELLIPIGFAYAPQVLNFLTVIPLLGRPIELILSVWSLLTAIVAVRQGLDIKTRYAALICLVGWPVIQLTIGFVQVFQQELVKRF